MAIILDLPEYRNMAGFASTTDAARDTSLQMILNEVNDAITRYIRQPLESATYTEYYNAPPTDRVVLRQWPVTAVTSVSYAQYSGGDPSKFTSDTLLTQYKDWILEVDRSDGSSRSGVIRSPRGFFGVNPRYPVRRLGYRDDPDYRALQIIYSAGFDQVPSSLKTVAALATSRIFHVRKFGTLPASASLNGASYSLMQFGNAATMFDDPIIAGFLRPFNDLFV